MSTQKHYDGDINSKYVLILKEHNNCLHLHKYPIDNSELIISDIIDIVEDQNATVWDIYSRTCNYFDYQRSYNLCYPYLYKDSFIKDAECPQKVPFTSINLLMRNRRSLINNSRKYKSLDEEAKQRYLDEQLYIYQKTISSKEYVRKKKYADDVIRYIKCSRLSKALDEIKEDQTIKMYSSDYIGWTTFEYKISDDINVIVKTNFDYGRSCYFFIAIKYKDMVLLPYSDLVNYYYANMKEFISYTQSYICERGSWNFALKYVADFVNESRENPEAFIKKYLLSEIKSMIKGLREIIKNPEAKFAEIKNNRREYIDTRVIRPFINEDQQYFEMMPQEFISVFKAEKISGALLFLESLKQVKDKCPEVIEMMREVEEMNLSIKPEVESTIDNIETDLKPLEKKYDEYDKEIDKLRDSIAKHKEKIARIVKPGCSHEEIEDAYKLRHPQYVKLVDRYDILRPEYYELGITVKRRKRMLQRMKVCLSRINK